MIIEETRFESAEDAMVGEFLYKLCVLGARLDRAEAENKALVACIEQLDTELKRERNARKTVVER